jgi:hypothetical protein
MSTAGSSASSTARKVKSSNSQIILTLWLPCAAYKLILFSLFLLYPSVSARILAFYPCYEVEGVSYLLSE